MTDALPYLQSPLLDIRWRGRGQLDLLGVSFASLKEKIDSEVGSAGVCWEGRGSSGVTGWLSHPDSNPIVCTAAAATAGRGPAALGHTVQVTQWAPPPLRSSPVLGLLTTGMYSGGCDLCMGLRPSGSGHNALQS